MDVEPKYKKENRLARFFQRFWPPAEASGIATDAAGWIHSLDLFLAIIAGRHIPKQIARTKTKNMTPCRERHTRGEFTQEELEKSK